MSDQLWQLRGCTYSIRYADRNDVLMAMTRLNTCPAHHGQHHFAVVAEGLGVLCSDSGIECLKEVGLA